MTAWTGEGVTLASTVRMVWPLIGLEVSLWPTRTITRSGASHPRASSPLSPGHRARKEARMEWRQRPGVKGALRASRDGLSVDGRGNIYVADVSNRTILKLTRAGTNWVVTGLLGKGPTRAR